MAQIKKEKEPSGMLAIVCGIVTVVLGAITCGFANVQLLGYLSLFLTIIINLTLHIESFMSNKKRGRDLPSVLTISIVEIFFVFFLIGNLNQLSAGSFDDFWKTLMIVYSSYLVFNGASLISLLPYVAKVCGCIAIVTGILVFITADSWGILSAVFLGSSLIINGGERVVMSLMAEKARKRIKITQCADQL